MSLNIELYGEIDFGSNKPYRICVFERNITHNLTSMASEAGIYDALWNGDGLLAGNIINTLQSGLSDLKARPLHYSEFNSSNGWGLYEHFVPFVEDVLQACLEYPKAKIWVSK